MTDIPFITHPSRKPPDSACIERELFDSLVDRNGDFDPFTERGWNTLRRAFQQCLLACGVDAPEQGFEMLDVGCGTGQSRQIYDGIFYKYTGLDLSPNAIRIAESRWPEHRWMIGDARNLPFAKNSLDLVAFSSVLHHIPEFSHAVSEALRVLKPGGLIFAYDPNLLHPAMALLRHPRSPCYISKGVSPNERPLHPNELRQVFLKSGLVCIHQHCQSNIPYRSVAPRRIDTFISAFNAVDWLWDKYFFGKMFGTFVVTAGTKPGETKNDYHNTPSIPQPQADIQN